MRHRFARLKFVAAAIVSVVSAVLLSSVTRAAEDESYTALQDWLERSRTITPQFTPGQHLTEKDRAVLEAFIPQSAWEYYFFPGMEIAATGQYPYPQDCVVVSK